jgi:hypothetical protein
MWKQGKHGFTNTGVNYLDIPDYGRKASIATEVAPTNEGVPREER